MSDRLVSDGEDEEDEEAVKPEAEDAGAGGDDAAGGRQRTPLLQDWPDDDLGDVADAGHVEPPAAPTGCAPAPRRRLRKTGENPPVGEPAVETRPHGKQPVEGQTAEVRPCEKHRRRRHRPEGGTP